MPVSAADLAALGDTPVTLQPTSFAHVYLGMNGNGVTAPADYGSGQLACEYTAGAYEKYKVRTQADGTASFESAYFPNVFLRMDGTGVTAASPVGGTVNCQYGPAGPYEKFKVHTQADGSLSFESAAFPNVYLRADGTGVNAASPGGGTVNCQFNTGGGANASFFLTMDDQHIDFAMQHQEQTYWCWDAATVSVAKFYDPAATWTQGALANTTFTRHDCSVAAGQVSPCNWGQWPDVPLQTVKHFNQRLNNALSSVQLGAQIAKAAPVVVNIAWAGGGGHIVALRGRSQSGGVEHVSVGDPWYGDSDVTYDSFRNAYQGNGVSYQTQR